LVETSGISCCFDEESAKMLDDYRREGLGDTSRAIASALEARSVKGADVLELGSGIGALTVELVKQGASSGRGIDLSPKMVQAARALAKESGLSESVTFELGDGATAQLPSSDIVVLDTVLCCYPDFGSLVDNSSSAARRLYAITVPDDRRILTRLLRLGLPLQRLISRRGSFRFFIHPTRSIIQRLGDRGFHPVFDSAVGRIWCVLLFSPSPEAQVSSPGAHPRHTSSSTLP
jgi:SAM-dependent methyltransferase